MSELNQEQIQQLVKNFYAKVQNDEILGLIFNDIAKVNWDKHIPLLTQFWCSVMLGTREYSGNPMLKHLELVQKTDLTPEHFERWLAIFSQEARLCMDEESARAIIKRATLIANTIQQKISQVKL